jgi:hypothetical protein
MIGHARSAWKSNPPSEPSLQITESKCAHLQESDRTLRDGSFWASLPRHFVPGYDRTVPAGKKPFAL